MSITRRTLGWRLAPPAVVRDVVAQRLVLTPDIN
jgi:hypothetical protein